MPQFQRDYSWKEEQWEDLWLDLFELTEGRSPQHYMGSIVLMQGQEFEVFTIIDGQQRIATLSILILAVIARLRELAGKGIESEANMERAAVLRNSFIGAKQAGSLLETSKLRLNSHDDDFYQGTLVQLDKPANERSLGNSEKLLWGAFKYFSRKIAQDLGRYSGRDLAEWLELKVSVHLLFIQVVVEDDIGAYTIFETLNARGLELTASDLIKNYLMSLVATKGKGDLSHILRRWHRLSARLGNRRLPEFLRHYFNSHFPYIRQERLFRRIREKFTTASEAISLVSDLEKASISYDALQDADHEFWLDFPGAADQVRALVLFGVSQYKPVALAAIRRLEPDAVVRVLRDCVTLSFRFNIISRLGTHELERLYNEVALGIESGELTTPASIRKRLMPVYVDDDQFKADFEIFRQPTTNEGKKILRYILCELERERSQRDLSWNNTTATIEHILPDNLTETWEKVFSEENHIRFVDRLGNYALLEKGKNKDAGQKVFSEKAIVFAGSQYQLTADLAANDEWDPAVLSQRQRELAKIAARVWSFPT